MAERFGEMFKRLRLEAGQTLRAFCVANGFDAGNISKLERGRMAAPESEASLARYATALGLKRESEEWHTFCDLAAAERGRVPTDLLSESELLDKLPVLFRVLRGTKAHGDGLTKLIDKIRKA